MTDLVFIPVYPFLSSHQAPYGTTLIAITKAPFQIEYDVYKTCRLPFDYVRSKMRQSKYSEIATLMMRLDQISSDLIINEKTRYSKEEFKLLNQKELNSHLIEGEKNYKYTLS